MVSFRKLILVMSVLVIVAGFALAQGPVAPIVTCTTNNQQTARFQQENQTALLPALTLTCNVAQQLTNVTFGDNIVAGTIYDWEVFFPVNAPLTVTTLHPVTEPQLYVEVDSGGPSDTNHPTNTVGEVEGTWGPYYAGAPPASSGTGIYPGNGVSSGGAVIFPLVDMNPEGDYNLAANPDVVKITIINLRASMLMLASNPPNYGGPMTLVVWAKPSQTTNAANQQNPGNVFLPLVNGVQSPTITLGVGYAAPSLAVSEYGSFDWRQCFSWSTAGKWADQFFFVDFTELYSYAFAPPTDGFETPSIGGPRGGTRLIFTFSSGGDNNWPSFVTIEVPAAIEVLGPGSAVYARAVLVSGADPTGNGGSLVSYTDDWAPNSDLGGTVTGDFYTPENWVTVDTVATDAGANRVIYEILPGATSAVTMTLEVPVMGMVNNTPTIYPPPDDTTAAVQIATAGYAPWTAGPVPQLAPIPRFIMPPTFQGSPLLEIDPCTTNLLYPYLVSGQGWDTGVAVANAGVDPFWGDGPYTNDASKAKAKPAVYGYSGNYNAEPGICEFYFYGSVSSAPNVPLQPLTATAVPVVLGYKGFAASGGSMLGDDPGNYIQPGTTGEAMISVALAQLYPTWNPATTSWNGYAIATCDFLYAHGFAYAAFRGSLALSSGGGYGVGYLALVLDQRGLYHKSQNPEKVTF